MFVARMARPPIARDFGLVPTPLWRAAGIVAGVYVGFYVFAGIWTQVLNIKEESDLPDELGANQSTAALVAVLVLVCVMAPVCEEFLFRGLLFTSLRVSIGMLPAAIITGAVFGSIHVGSSPVGLLVPLAVLGFGLCLIYAWTRSLYPCVALHAVNNAIAFGVTQDWTLADPAPRRRRDVRVAAHRPRHRPGAGEPQRGARPRNLTPSGVHARVVSYDAPPPCPDAVSSHPPSSPSRPSWEPRPPRRRRTRRPPRPACTSSPRRSAASGRPSSRAPASACA